MNNIYDTLILGGGPAGLSAGIYCARAGLKTAVIDTSMIGGTPVNYLEIENYPGFSSIEGFELSEKLEEHMDKFDVDKFSNVEIKAVDLVSDVKKLETLDGKIFEAKTVILATGAKPKKLEVKGEVENIGKGVSYCAVCDGAFYKDKKVVVVGGGNAAVEEAVYLTRFAKEVYVVHRRDTLRADKIIQDRAFKTDNLHFIYDSVVDEIIAENNHVTAVKLRNVKTKRTENFQTDGVFVYIGFTPNVETFNGQLEQDRNGFVVTDINMRTSVYGVFAIGDVRVTPLRQVITAVSDGAVAGVYASKYLQELKVQEGVMS